MLPNKNINFIDENHHFRLEFTYVSNKLEINIVSYISSNGEFAKNFSSLLRIKIKDKFYELSNSLYDIDESENIIIYIKSTKYLTLLFQDTYLTITENFRKLVVFETRLIGRYKNDYIPQMIQSTELLTTDLHTHLSGQIDSVSLIKIGLKHNLLYPVSFFDKLNISYKKDNLQKIKKMQFIPLAHLYNELECEYAIPFNDLDEYQLELLCHAMALSPESQSTFEDMENCYYLREPFTKNIDLIEDIFEAIALNYQMNNVTYAELSSNSVIDPTWLTKIESFLPHLEENIIL